MPTTEQLVQIRWMMPQHFSQVIAIERRSFRQPWDESQLLAFLQTRNAIGRVALDAAGQPLGYMLTQIYPEETRIVSLAVAADHRRQGVGRQMVRYLCEMAKLHGARKTVRVDVPERNLGAQLFFSRCQMRAVEVISEYWQNPAEDAFRFVWHPAIGFAMRASCE